MKVDYWISTKKIQLKENSMENSAEKNLKENSQFNELWNFSIKQKRKKKTNSKSKSFFFVSFVWNPLLKTLYDLFESVSELESCWTYCLNLPFELPFDIAH